MPLLPRGPARRSFARRLAPVAWRALGEPEVQLPGGEGRGARLWLLLPESWRRALRPRLERLVARSGHAVRVEDLPATVSPAMLDGLTPDDLCRPLVRKGELDVEGSVLLDELLARGGRALALRLAADPAVAMLPHPTRPTVVLDRLARTSVDVLAVAPLAALRQQRRRGSRESVLAWWMKREGISVVPARPELLDEPIGPGGRRVVHLLPGALEPALAVLADAAVRDAPLAGGSTVRGVLRRQWRRMATSGPLPADRMSQPRLAHLLGMLTLLGKGAPEREGRTVTWILDGAGVPDDWDLLPSLLVTALSLLSAEGVRRLPTRTLARLAAHPRSEIRLAVARRLRDRRLARPAPTRGGGGGSPTVATARRGR